MEQEQKDPLEQERGITEEQPTVGEADEQPETDKDEFEDTEEDKEDKE